MRLNKSCLKNTTAKNNIFELKHCIFLFFKQQLSGLSIYPIESTFYISIDFSTLKVWKWKESTSHTMLSVIIHNNKQLKLHFRAFGCMLLLGNKTVLAVVNHKSHHPFTKHFSMQCVSMLIENQLVLFVLFAQNIQFINRKDWMENNRSEWEWERERNSIKNGQENIDCKKVPL